LIRLFSELLPSEEIFEDYLHPMLFRGVAQENGGKEGRREEEGKSRRREPGR
jgi:hypothetical protein